MKFLLRLLALAAIICCPFMFGMEMEREWHAVPGIEVLGADLKAANVPDVEDMMKNVTLYYVGDASGYKKGRKFRVLFVYNNTESYASDLRGLETALIKTLENIIPDLAKSILSNSLGQGKVIASGYATEFEILTYQHKNNSDRLARLIEALNEKDNQLVIFAEGENATTVTLATHKLAGPKDIHALIFFQPPIYESYIGLTGYSINEAYKPIKFNRLYNFYTKSDYPVKGAQGYQYPERKYRQQYRLVNGLPVLPVKNISVLKNLEFMPVKEFVTDGFILKVPQIIMAISENYLINFDLFTDIEPKGTPVAVNRFVKMDKDMPTTVRAFYGTDAAPGWYEVFKFASTTDNQLFKIVSRQFTDEFLYSQEQLKELLPRGVVGKTMNAYYDRIIVEYQNIGSNWLFNQAEEKKIKTGIMWWTRQ